MKTMSIVCQKCYHTIGIDNQAIFSSSIAFGNWGEPYAYMDIKCHNCGHFHTIRTPIKFGAPEILYCEEEE
jgi:ribosomal protein S27E